MAARIEGFFDSATSTISYVVADPASKTCCVIDPVLDFDPRSGRTSRTSADQLIAYVRGNGLTVRFILETHAHADHLSAAVYLKSVLGGEVAISREITHTQKAFAKLLNLKDIVPDGRQFDRLLGEGDRIELGALSGAVWHTPGHTPGCLTFIFGDAAFVGDTLFMPDYGTARTDFPGGDAATLFRSIQRILGLPPATRLFLCHDYRSSTRDITWQTTVAAQADNIHLRGHDEAAFVAMRTARDKTLSKPDLLIPAIQVNIRGGHLPAPDDNGAVYLKWPIDVL